MDDVSKELGLFRRGNVWAYRRRIPTDLLGTYAPAKERKKSLGTQDLKTAKRLRNRLAAQWDDEFQKKRTELQHGKQRPPRREASLNFDEIESLIHLHVSSKSTAFFEELQSPSVIGFDDSVWEMENEARENILYLTDPADAYASRCVYDLYRDIFENYQALQQRLSPAEDAQIRDLLRRAALELERRKLACLQRQRLDKSFDETFVAPRERIVTLQIVADEYLAEHQKTKSVGSKRRSMLKAAVQIVIDFFGSNTDVSKLDGPQCREFRDMLNKLPSNLRKHFPDRSLTFAKIAQRAEMAALPRMKQVTQDKYIHALKEILSWAQSERYISFNPAVDIKALGEKTPAKLARDPFSIADLQKIFGSKLYTELDRTTARYWVPLIALFTGMRENEICQLDVSDVRVSDLGTPYIRIDDGVNQKRVKNARSKRSIPIHPELIRIGLLQFVRRQAEASKLKLFPELRVSRHGYHAERVSRWANEQFLPRVGVKGTSKNGCLLRPVRVSL